MKKTVIALSVAAALPVAAQADVTLSGSVSAEYSLGSNLVPTIETKLSADSSELIANGMTASASFDVLGEETQGTIGLEGGEGGFGELKAGTAASSAEANDVDETSESIEGVAYTGTFAGLSVNLAKGTWDHDSDDGDNTVDQEYTSYGASYDFNGLIVTGQRTTKETGVDATTEFVVSYAFGDLTVSGSKSTDEDVVVKAAYAATMDDLAVNVSADSVDKWDLEAIYTMGDLAVTAKDDQDVGGAKISAKYTSGDLSLEVDSNSKVTVVYNLGNADLSMVREKDESTKVKYTVSF